jgi:hypothetical protein
VVVNEAAGQASDEILSSYSLASAAKVKRLHLYRNSAFLFDRLSLQV